MICPKCKQLAHEQISIDSAKVHWVCNRCGLLSERDFKTILENKLDVLTESFTLIDTAINDLNLPKDKSFKLKEAVANAQEKIYTLLIKKRMA